MKKMKIKTHYFRCAVSKSNSTKFKVTKKQRKEKSYYSYSVVVVHYFRKSLVVLSLPVLLSLSAS